MPPVKTGGGDLTWGWTRQLCLSHWNIQKTEQILTSLSICCNCVTLWGLDRYGMSVAQSHDCSTVKWTTDHQHKTCQCVVSGSSLGEERECYLVENITLYKICGFQCFDIVLKLPLDFWPHTLFWFLSLYFYFNIS